jgi:hypothetical protein
MSRPHCPCGAEELTALAFGELAAERAAALQRHLAECPACQAEMARLRAAAEVLERVRAAPEPEPVWTRPAPRPARAGWWQAAPWRWALAGAAAGALAAALWLLLWPPAGRAPAPPAPAAAAAPVARLVAAAGPVAHTRAAGRGRATVGQGLAPGDRIATGGGGRLQLELADGSRLGLGPRSALGVIGAGRFALDRGTLACRVRPRAAGRPLVVRAGGLLVRVVGTRFAVRRGPDGAVAVGVAAGAVELRRTGRAPLRLVAGRQARYRPAGEALELTALAPELRAALDRLAPAGDKPPAAPAAGPRDADRPDASGPADRSRDASRPAAGGPDGAGPQTAPAADPTGKAQPGAAAGGEQPGAAAADPAGDKPPAAPAAGPRDTDRPEADGSLAGLVASIHRDTGWLFDELRLELEAGRTRRALRLLDNYLADPLSPHRDEAVFLRARCLEQLQRLLPAARAYRRYLDRWPTGKRAPAARQALRRLRRRHRTQ